MIGGGQILRASPTPLGIYNRGGDMSAGRAMTWEKNQRLGPLVVAYRLRAVAEKYPKRAFSHA